MCVSKAEEIVSQPEATVEECETLAIPIAIVIETAFSRESFLREIALLQVLLGRWLVGETALDVQKHVFDIQILLKITLGEHF